MLINKSMANQSSQPKNQSFLSPIGFKFVIQRMPHVNYFCTSANMPEITLPAVETHSPFVKQPRPSTKLDFGALNLRFRIDEDMKNYREIYDWLIFMGFPDKFEQRDQEGTTVYSDASLIITTAAFKPNIEIKFVDLFPISMNANEFDIDQTDIEYLTADASFAFRKYELTDIA